MTSLHPPIGEVRLVDDVPAAFADLVVAVQSAKNGDDTCRLALSGGETARSCYERLAEAPVDWASLEVFLGDERCVGPDDPAANQRLIREALGDRFSELGAFHPMSCDDPEGYGRLLESKPALDLVHLGLGPDGHTASLFPGSTALSSPPGFSVVLNEDPAGHNPLPRLTLTFEAIARSRLVVFTVAGASKHRALNGVLSGQDLPAARVRAEQVLWLCDSEALGAAPGSAG